MKKIFAAVTAFCLLLPWTAFAQPVYEDTTEETVIGGVTHKNVRKFYGDYALDIDIVTADLKNENITLELLKSTKGVDKRDTVMNFAKNNENTVSAINADFFSLYKGDQNFSLGIEVKDEKLLQSHINDNMAAGIFKDGALSLSYISFNASVTAPSGMSTPLAHVNKPTDYYGALLMYTPDFNGGVSPFLPVGITAVTVREGKVSAKGTSLGGTIPIPEDGYILVINDSMTPFLDINFNIGDTVDLKIDASGDALRAKTAFGGGTLLLSGGEKTPITHKVNGNNPRTAIGTNEDGTLVYFITVDGRQTQSRGVTLEELADICLEAGCSNALNLDGGGSTAMVGKTLENEDMHYFNTPTENRKVINAVAFTAKEKAGEAVGAFVKPENENVLLGDSVKLKITPYDKNFAKPSTNNLSLNFVTSNDAGYAENTLFYAKKAGECVTDVYCNEEKTDSFKVNVIGEIAGIVAKKEYRLSVGESISTEDIAEVFDKDGKRAKVRNIELLNPVYDKNFIKIADGKLTVLKEGGGKITLGCDGAKRDIKIISGNYDADIDMSITNDPAYEEKDGGFTFDVFGFVGADTLFDRVVYARCMDIFRKADAAAIVGNDAVSTLTPKRDSLFTAQKFLEKDCENAKIISMELSDKGVVSRGQQWRTLSNALSNARQKNVFILLRSEYGFQTQTDKDAFSGMLSNAAKDKNVFVIYNADEYFCDIKDNVRYISLADVKDEKLLHRAIENVRYLSFNITEDTVTYCFKKIY